MDMIHNLENYVTEHQSNEDVTMKQKHNSLLAQTTESENSNSSFECNICFESAHDPVVTLCGHLYCWGCIFKWLHVQASSSEQACPVCKANISQASLIPLYCHGPSHTESELKKNPCPDLIPPRPTGFGLQTRITASNRHSNQQLPSDPFTSMVHPTLNPTSGSLDPSSIHHRYFSDPYANYATISSSSNLLSTTMAGIINPTIGLLGELVYTRMFGSTDETNFIGYPLRSSYAMMGSDNPRIRRQELQLDKSLNRVSMFLFCCLILCLLLF